MRISITADDETIDRLLAAYEKVATAAEDMPWREDLAEALQDLSVGLGRLSARITESGG